MYSYYVLHVIFHIKYILKIKACLFQQYGIVYDI